MSLTIRRFICFTTLILINFLILTTCRTLPRQILGYYTSQAGTEDGNFSAVAAAMFLPADLALMNVSQWWIIPEPANSYVAVYKVAPSWHLKFPFKLHQTENITFRGQSIQYAYSFALNSEVGVNTTSNLLRANFSSGNQTFIIESQFDDNRATLAFKCGKLHASRVYVRTLNGIVFGTYRGNTADQNQMTNYVPEIGNGFSEIYITIGCSKPSEEYQYKVFNDAFSRCYFFKVTEPGVNHTVQGDRPGHIVYTHGLIRPDTEAEILRREILLENGNNETVKITAAWAGLEIHHTVFTPRFNQHESKTRFRRVLPSNVLGIYDCVEPIPKFDFGDSIGTVDIEYNKTVEFYESSDGKYHQKYVINGIPGPDEWTFELGKRYSTTFKGMKGTYKYLFVEAPEAVLHFHFTDQAYFDHYDPRNLIHIANEFDETGYTNVRYRYGDRIASRRFTRRQ